MRELRNLLSDLPALTVAERAALEFNDEDNARRVLSEFGADLVFVSGKGWAVWDGTRYSFRNGDLMALRKARRLRQLVQEEAEWARKNWDFDPDDVRRFMEACEAKRPPVIFKTERDAISAMRREFAGRLYGHATKCGNIAKVKSALEVAATECAAQVRDMDADPWVLVCPNGEIDLRAARDFERPVDADAGEVAAIKRAWLRPTRRDHMPTRCAGVDFDPAAICPNWERFIALILPDADVRACVQRALGATVFGENAAQVCLILRGPGGNGKSTLLNTLAHVLGRNDGYAASCKIEMFLDTGPTQANSATPGEANLPGARAYIATEPGARDVLAMKKIKGLTGGDERESRGLYAAPFYWTPRGVPILSCNRTPKIKDEDEGTRRRLIFVPFDVNLRALPADQQRAQGDVEAELFAEGSGVLNWLLDGFTEFMERGIDPPETMRALKEKLLEAADPVGVFINEMCVVQDGGRLNVTAFYKTYEAWCERDGHAIYQPKTVREVMIEKGYNTIKTMGLSCWKNLTWATDAADLVETATGQRPDTAPPPEVTPF
ncbi:primase/helicase [Dinoroseobacter phage vB_DshS-R4C]|nr:primase/helicase [Dinoroseobacter phage vB_DshS-R4C]